LITSRITSRTPLPIHGVTLPLRVDRLLCDGEFVTLDAIHQPLYRSAMNQFERHQEAPCPDAMRAEAGGTLFTFLEVAEQLYERIAQALARVGLSYAKYEVLQYLRSKGPASLGVVAEAQRCARSNITQLIDRLETEGLVRRVDDPDDRRGVRAELTPLGAARVEQGATQIDLVRSEFAASLSESESEELVRLLAKVQR
jgi:DNA-binding MarR family transcriptional regulator